jgi:prevent-host-death family protein
MAREPADVPTDIATIVVTIVGLDWLFISGYVSFVLRTATISETKNRLSGLLDLVRNGETVLILDRNRPVARIVPIDAHDEACEEARLGNLQRCGLLHPARDRFPRDLLDASPPLPLGRTGIVDALLGERNAER